MGKQIDDKQVADALEIIIRELDDCVPQLSLKSSSLAAIDRALDLDKGDVILCDFQCAEYAAHVLCDNSLSAELWMISPMRSLSFDNDGIVQVEECCDELVERFSVVLPGFRGFTSSLPAGPVKMLTTWGSYGIPIEPFIDQVKWGTTGWYETIMTRKGSRCALLIDRDGTREGMGTLTEGNFANRGLAWSIELPSNRIVLGLDSVSEICHVEDLSSAQDPWRHDASSLFIAVNDGCLVPSMLRRGVEVLEETTLDALASRISRGTSIREKNLDIKKTLHAKVVENPNPQSEKTPIYSASGCRTVWDECVYAREDDLYYVDSSCFNNGEVWPHVLASMPEGQERYIVNRADGKVLLVSRNGKQSAVYEALRPTLIADSVFVVRLWSDIDREYLACWIRGQFAQAHLFNGGKILSKGMLASLPVPILGSGPMGQVLRYEQSIDEKIRDLLEEVERLKAINRFAPRAAILEYAKGAKNRPEGLGASEKVELSLKDAVDLKKVDGRSLAQNRPEVDAPFLSKGELPVPAISSLDDTVVEQVF
ncbi:MAG: hypothetical protein ACOYIP_06930 [Coriobacteriales bacterium]|jgi:hypothetical protein